MPNLTIDAPRSSSPLVASWYTSRWANGRRRSPEGRTRSLSHCTRAPHLHSKRDRRLLEQRTRGQGQLARSIASTTGAKYEAPRSLSKITLSMRRAGQAEEKTCVRDSRATSRRRPRPSTKPVVARAHSNFKPKQPWPISPSQTSPPKTRHRSRWLANDLCRILLGQDLKRGRAKD